MTPAELSQFVKAAATGLGLSLCGMTRAVSLPQEKVFLKEWLREGRNGSMYYMSQYVEQRTDPTLLVRGAKTIISSALSYAPRSKQDSGTPRIARYAFGKDYHYILKDKLHRLLHYISEAAGPVNARVFVDTAPVLERIWAARSGLGWLGKNGLLINQQLGSYLFLGEIIMDLETTEDRPVRERCGSCTKCLTACPPKAFTAPGQMDARKCLSYLTIEFRKPVPADRLYGWIFGCDICQEVCPWNRLVPPTHEHGFEPVPEILHGTREQWLNMDEEEFKHKFLHSPLWRSGLKKIKSHLSSHEKE